MTNIIDLPAIYNSADHSSQVGQQRFLLATRIRLVALLTAAIGGAAAWKLGEFDLFGWLALVAFVLALAAGFYILATDPEQLWYEGRAAAESAKTLAWRYAAGGDPFPLSQDPTRADRLLLERLNQILTDLERIPAPVSDSPAEQISHSMRSLRTASFDVRKAAYLSGRIIDQEAWYKQKARYNEKRAHLFTWTAIALEFAGVIGAALKAFNVVNVDLLGILSAGAAGITAWGQARQYAFNGRAYSIAYHELVSIRSELQIISEAEWSRYVEEAEEAISREHTLWRASKGIVLPLRNRGVRRDA